ncbi:hypothetical protein [Vibrio barjaei]|uniref:hypothetical protein n=1 Tax=Vibrio barjaei TaxID=1676683 RepID=UPI002283C1B5|nr:hypothetical protein [Vibrio barjaei]MCY9870367.1 hypothetical protein [Vibrio barjaei]
MKLSRRQVCEIVQDVKLICLFIQDSISQNMKSSIYHLRVIDNIAHLLGYEGFDDAFEKSTIEEKIQFSVDSDLSTRNLRDCILHGSTEFVNDDLVSIELVREAVESVTSNRPGEYGQSVPLFYLLLLIKLNACQTIEEDEDVGGFPSSFIISSGIDFFSMLSNWDQFTVTDGKKVTPYTVMSVTDKETGKDQWFVSKGIHLENGHSIGY